MKIIALSCSPSRGRNSDTMLDNFIVGLKEVKNLEIEKIYLGDIPIDYYSYENSNGPTENEILFKNLIDKMVSADGLVIATPTYNFSVPAHLKNFIDRLRPVALDLSRKNSLGQPVGKLGHLRTYFLVSGGTPSWAQKILFLCFSTFLASWSFSIFWCKSYGRFLYGKYSRI